MEISALVMSACDLRWRRVTAPASVRHVLLGGKECAYAKQQQTEMSTCVDAALPRTPEKAFNGSRYLSRNETPPRSARPP